jgi:N-acetylglutamate synthase-like GNAT family acetyltransferase
MVKIREAREEDEDVILDLLVKNNLYKEDFEDLLPRFIVATDEGKIVGCISHAIFDTGIFLIRSLAVADEYKRKGIGTQLGRLKIEYARKNGFKKIYVKTLVINNIARHLSDNLGFSIIDDQELYKYFPNCNHCRKDVNRMTKYCQEHSKNGECPMLAYSLNI